MIPYILHVALLISVCLVFYKVLLQRETFYRLNRWVLVFCLALSFALPLIRIPQRFTLRDTPKAAAVTTPEAINYNTPVIQAQNNAAKKQAIANADASPLIKATSAAVVQPGTSYRIKL